MSIFFPYDIQNIVIKYIPKEMINYLKNKQYMWKKLYYELYRETKVSLVYQYPRNRNIKDEYLNGILNRLFAYHRIESFSVQKAFFSTIKIFIPSGITENPLRMFEYSNSSKQNSELKEKLVKIDDPHNFIGINTNKTIIQIEYNAYPGSVNTFVLFNDGTLMAKGANDKFRFGLDNNNIVEEFIYLKIGKKVVQIASGFNYTFLVLDDGNIMVAGTNSFVPFFRTYDETIKKFEVVNTSLIIEELANIYNIPLESKINKVMAVKYFDLKFYLLFENGMVIYVNESKPIMTAHSFSTTNFSPRWSLLDDGREKIVNIKLENTDHIIFIKENGDTISDKKIYSKNPFNKNW